MGVGEMEQHHEAGLAFDEGAHRRTIERPTDEVALPMAGNCPVVDLGRALGDRHHVGENASRPHMRRAAAHPARAQATGQLAAQLTTALDEERLVDRLVAHPHHRIVWELEAQAAGDLLGRPEPLQPGRHLLAEGSRRQLDHLRAACDSTARS